MKKIESSLKVKVDGLLGRDSNPAFSHFASSQENAATLLIRMTVEILGPQDDEKSGCREEWFVFCEKKEVKCRFTSFRGNRFNNLFDNSSALIFQKHHIPDFFGKFCFKW